VKAEHENLPEIQKYLEKVWKELYPTKPFESQYQEELVLGNSRNLNTNLEKIFLFITVLGGLLSASGIFALASLNIAKRTKEIGIRKALGASVNNIVGLLNREFTIILIIAAIIGSAGDIF
jgi:ABC-type antimicrobial peptide transport system permease subunit